MIDPKDIFTKDLFGRKTYRIVTLTPKESEESRADLSQNPTLEDIALEVVFGKYRGVCFRLLNVLVDEEIDDRLAMMCVIKVIRVPVRLNAIKSLLLNNESPAFMTFYDKVAIKMVRDFVEDAIEATCEVSRTDDAVSEITLRSQL